MRNSKQANRAKAFNNKNSFHFEVKTLFGDLNSTVNGKMRILAVKYDIGKTANEFHNCVEQNLFENCSNTMQITG